MRLIDADALKEKAIRVSTVKEHCYMKAVGTREIDKAPTVDAVEVVRCKDCEFFKDTWTCDDGRVYGYCPHLAIEHSDNGYCHYGIKK